MTLIAHVSDTHFGGPPDARARAEAVLAHLLALDPRPDVLLVSGDVADHGLPDEYAEARAVLDAWPGPMLVGTGNHDVRDAFARGLLDMEATARSPGPRGRGVRILMLDSLVAAPRRRADRPRRARRRPAGLARRAGSRTTTSRRSSPCTTRLPTSGWG